MFEIQRSVELDAGHRVPYHGSKCRNIHGHRYRVTAVVQGEDLVPPEEKKSDSGMVLDFGEIKKVLMEEIHDVYDHSLMLWAEDPIAETLVELMKEHGSPASPGVILLPIIPTAEGLAAFWGKKLYSRMFSEGAGRWWLSSLEVEETPNSFASFLF